MTKALARKHILIGEMELEHGTRRDAVGLGGVYPLAALTVSRMETVRMTMTIENNTGAAVTRDLASFYGYLTAPGEFTFHFACIRPGVSIGVGTTTHHVDCGAAVAGAGYDALGAIGKHAPPHFHLEHGHVKRNQLTVTGVIVKDFALGRA